MRNALERITINPSGGLNEQSDSATLDQLEIAENVWAPNGRIESRPGFVGVMSMPSAGTSSGGLASAFYCEDVSAGTCTVINNPIAITKGVARTGIAPAAVVASDRLYSRYLNTIVHSSLDRGSVKIFLDDANTAKTYYFAEYYNTDGDWKLLTVTQTSFSGLSNSVSGFFNDTEGSGSLLLQYAVPWDLASAVTPTNLASLGITDTGAWIRFTFLDADVVGTVGDVDFQFGSGFGGQYPPKAVFFSFPNGKKRFNYLNTWRSFNASDIFLTDNREAFMYPGTSPTIPGATVVERVEPGTMADVVEYGETFIAFENKVYRHTPIQTAGDDVSIIATVEDLDFAVGTNAPYDPAYVSQLSEFPRCKYIARFDNRLWAAGIEGEPNKIRWGAASPYHKVWPSLSFEIVSSSVDSAITGMAVYGEQVVVFTRNSIWIMVDTGEDEVFGLQTYVPRQVVSGIGCVASGSIKQIRGELIFLSESGLYAFNGSPIPRKVSLDIRTGSDRLLNTIAAIRRGQFAMAHAANWASQNLYLLSVCAGPDEKNNTTIVWDYDGDTFWIWTDFEVKMWIEDKESDDGTIYFMDSDSNVMQFGVGQTDHGATITSTIKTHRIANDFAEKKRVREVRALSTNATRSLTVEVVTNDELSGASGALTFVDSNDKDWSSFNYASGAATDDNFDTERRCRNRLEFSRDCDWFQVKVTHNQKYQKFKLSSLMVGFESLGAR